QGGRLELLITRVDDRRSGALQVGRWWRQHQHAIAPLVGAIAVLVRAQPKAPIRLDIAPGRTLGGFHRLADHAAAGHRLAILKHDLPLHRAQTCAPTPSGSEESKEAECPPETTDRHDVLLYLHPQRASPNRARSCCVSSHPT